MNFEEQDFDADDIAGASYLGDPGDDADLTLPPDSSALIDEAAAHVALRLGRD